MTGKTTDEKNAGESLLFPAFCLYGMAYASMPLTMVKYRFAVIL